MFTVEVVCPELKLDDELAQIKQKVLAAREKPTTLSFTADEFTQFAPRLEGHWGALYDSLPAFHAALLNGNWEASDTQAVPSSLLGDFGEFVSARVFQVVRAPKSRVARVLRPAGKPRPDFLVLDESKGELTALESKSTSVNAMRLRRAIERLQGPARLNRTPLCGSARDRRESGQKQIGMDAVITDPTGQARYRLHRPVARVKSRIFANASAIATPVFLDGRVRDPAFLDLSRLRQPRGCPHRCVECLRTKDGNPILLVPLFLNESDLVEPLLPDNFDAAAFFEAYLLVCRAFWVEDEALVLAAWKQLLNVLALQAAFAKDPVAAAQPLLDILAVGLDLDVIGDGSKRLSELEYAQSESRPANKPISITAALTLHAFQDDASEEEPSAVDVVDDTRREDVRTPPIATEGARIEREIDAVEREQWFRRRGATRRTHSRERLFWSLSKPLSQSWSRLFQLLRANPEKTAIVDLRVGDTSASAARPPLGLHPTCSIRIAGPTPTHTFEAAINLLALAAAMHAEGEFHSLVLTLREQLSHAGVYRERWGPFSRLSHDEMGAVLEFSPRLVGAV